MPGSQLTSALNKITIQVGKKFEAQVRAHKHTHTHKRKMKLYLYDMKEV